MPGGHAFSIPGGPSPPGSAQMSSSSSPPTVHLTVSERHILKAVLEFLESRGLHISQLSLERETGLINGDFSDDVLFLRQLILDGQWEGALDFVEPLKDVDEFDFRMFRYNVTKYKFFELLCIKMEPGPMHDNDLAVEELVECLKDLEHIAPSPEDYRQLCALLTLPKLADHDMFKQWNPSGARVECFHKVLPLIRHLLPAHSKDSDAQSTNDRLVSLLMKGTFYEGCVDYCQAQAIGEAKLDDSPVPSTVLAVRPRLGPTDLSLVSWLENVGREQFAMPFQQKNLDLKVELLKKPKLNAKWTEQILHTPIRPARFPHALVPEKSRLADKMSRSMMAAMPLSGGGDMGMSVFSAAPVPPMSQSVAPGFCLGRDVEPASEQQQMLESMLESSQLTKSSRPVGPAPTMAASFSGDFSHSRRQLDEMTRRSLPPSSQRQSSLPPVPEVSTPNGGEDGGDVMTSSRLFQQFASRQKSAEPVMIRQQPTPPMQTPPLQQMHMQQMRPQQPYPMMGGAPMGGMMPGMYQPPHMQPNMYGQMPGVPMQHMAQQPIVPQSSRPQSMVGPPAPSQQARPLSMPNPTGSSIQFVPVCRYEDSQAIRAVSFHPSGRYFAVGTNSKQMHVCRYPDINHNRSIETRNAEILLSRPKQHRGSVYCLSFSPSGDLLATGSNDKTIRLMSFQPEQCRIGAEMEVCAHDGTVREVVFSEGRGGSLLLSGGAGDCRIHATDCNTGKVVASWAGHSAPILGMFPFGEQFATCSQDKSIRIFDVRMAEPTKIILPGPKTSNAPVTSVCVDPSGQLLVSGHEDASVGLYDMTGGRTLQTFRPHADEVRTVRFSNAAYYLLSASYDKRVVITDMRGDLMAPLMYLPVAEHTDKVIQCRWHPHDFSFLSTSADRSAVLWALPPRFN